MVVPAHGVDMYQPTAARSNTEYRAPPSVTVSLVLAALTTGCVLLVSIVTTAPAVVVAFLAGAVTAAVVTVVHRTHVGRRASRVFAESRLQ